MKVSVYNLAGSVVRIAVPTSLILALVALFDSRYGWQNVFLLNEAIGPRSGPQRHYWFVETIVYTMLALLAALAVPAVDRWERRLPFALPVALLAAGLTVRYGVLPVSPWDNFATPAMLFWFFALGWAGARAETTRHRLLVSALAVVLVAGFFGQAHREVIVLGGFLLLLWRPHVVVTPLLAKVAGVLAGASLFIYLTHWQVYPPLEDAGHQWLALVASLTVGIAYARVARPVHQAVGRAVLRAR